MDFLKQILVFYRAVIAYLFSYFQKIIKKIKNIETKFYFNSLQKQIAVIILIVIVGVFLLNNITFGIEIMSEETLPLSEAGPMPDIIGDTVGGFMLDTLRQIINGFFMLLITVFGFLLTLLIQLLIQVAQYNDFINSDIVSTGWTMVRDICNMFFVIVLLVIAFATVLKIQSYSYKNLLKKLIIMALLINFSKTICGFFIDFAQVAMLTFVNAFKDASYNLVEMLGITSILKLAAITPDESAQWKITGAIVIGAIMVIITCVVVLIFVLVLLVRIIYLWLLVVLSPLAYMLSSFPGGQSYASRWWDYFTKQLIVGPLLAFFLWLSLASAANFSGKITLTNVSLSEENVPAEYQIANPAAGAQQGTAQVLASEATQPAVLRERDWRNYRQSALVNLAQHR